VHLRYSPGRHRSRRRLRGSHRAQCQPRRGGCAQRRPRRQSRLPAV